MDFGTSNPYSDCRSPEEFERRRQLINLIIFWTMDDPIKMDDYCRRERDKIHV